MLDEPSVGLHQRDNRKLVETLLRLRDIGNTVLVVEHDEETIRIADYVVDIGPGAGEHGGEVICAGSVADLVNCRASITGQYLSGKRSIAVPSMRREPRGEWLVVRGAEHNLKGIDVEIPLGCFVSVTGVSGSGKSTLINDILLRALMQRIYKSRVVPGDTAASRARRRSTRSSTSTSRRSAARHARTRPPIRACSTASGNCSARPRSLGFGVYQPGRFSFNVPGGRCEACAGDGTLKIEMHFLPDVYVPCEVCKAALQPRHARGGVAGQEHRRGAGPVLRGGARELLAAQPVISRHLRTLVDVGLGYIRLGQPAPTLSGGEAQRVKLASELAKRSTGHTLYVLDEPTTGLHFEDVRKLLDVLQRLVDQGNTVCVIEHNLDVVKSADWVIDLGPEGGDGGGSVIAEGTPEKVAKTFESYTGRFLAPLLKI